MSVSDSESSSSSHGGEYKFFRQITRDRLLFEMLGSTRTGDSKSTWKVLIMDKVTVKVMSHSCKMSDITDQGISLVEDLFRRREPMTSMDAIYFIQPSKENVVMFLSDMSGREPLYKKAYVFFSSSVPKELVNHIKCDTSVLPRIGALREMNLEYFPIDNQAFITDHEGALGELYGKNVENSRRFDACLNTMATRIATVFASLNELPFVRYRAAKATDDSTATFRDSIPAKLAAGVWNNLLKYKCIPNFPQTETCELLILDRSIDQIAPVIHEWTYDAMCHDLLEMDGNKYVVELPSKTGGSPEKKEVLLEDQDLVWRELRHAHIADASERLHDKMTTFVSKNKAAQMQQSARDGSEISTRDLQKIVQALPKYNEQVEKLTLHIEIAGKINSVIRELGLRDLGQLEQDLVFGDAGAKDVISFLRTKQDASPENKLRLLMIYACVYPEKFEGDKASKLMQLARLSNEDMKVVNNMKLLGGSSETKKTSGGFSLKFDNQKTKQAARKDRTDEEETWQLFRFYPVLEELLEKLSKRELPKSEYSCMNDPSSTDQERTKRGSVRNSHASPAPAVPERKAPAQSMRSRRTATWARTSNSDDGHSSDSVLKSAAKEFKKMGQRIFVFIIGGATRSELRACHKLTTKLGREIVLGCSSLDDPPQYITKLKLLSETEISTEVLRF
ncbi:protein transport Sec1a-like isoform X1 [Populus nigra]|uniref:protein transport Sec1a-like isoform X1 n=1 Tax=Populus nigra TaxID=3691 RepID=UPI002B265251|nr:protein transport Sec1a-like isoform X1 [Populus nigra]